MSWQPIDTAPLDRPILVTDGKLVVAGSLSLLEPDGSERWLDPVGFGGYEWDWDFLVRELTHWMPVPELP